MKLGIGFSLRRVMQANVINIIAPPEEDNVWMWDNGDTVLWDDNSKLDLETE